MRYKRPLFLAIAVSLPLLIGAAAPQFVDQLRTFAVSLTHPFLEFQAQASHFFKTEIQYVLEWPRLRKENEALRVEVESLRSKVSNLEEVKRENLRLKELLSLKEKVHQKAVAARVIGRDPSHWSQFIVINKGLRDGIRKNTVLVHPDGLVGRVISAGRHSARAILLVDGESRASAMSEKARVAGLIEGTGSLMLKMTYLDRTSEIEVGDIIISSGLGGIYPKGIPVGKVQLVGGEKDRPSLYALVKPFVSFSKLEEVLCVSSLTAD